MPVFVLEESTYTGPIEDDTVLNAEVVVIKSKEKPWEDENNPGHKLQKIEFTFVVTDPDSPHDGQKLWGETSTTFSDNEKCVREGTLVSPIGSLAGAASTFYEGPEVSIKTMGGASKPLAVTVNHPVLTTRGWVPAGLLRKGDYLVRCVGADGRQVSSASDFEYMPAPIEEVQDALRALGHEGLRTAARGDFYGDERFFQGQVDVVLADGLLRGNDQPSAFQQSLQRELVGTGRGPGSLSGASTGLGLLDRVALSAPSLVGRAGVGWVVPATTDRDASLAQYLRGTRVADVELLHQLHQTLAVDVSLDEVIDVKWGWWSGHVFNLDTGSGTYWADGILTHNCKLRNWAMEIMGVDTLDPGFRLDTDDLQRQACRIVVGARKKKDKSGVETDEISNFVKDVLRIKSGSSSLSSEEPF